jgi:two-component system chemotaxis sensor kinase CheA
MRRLARDLAQQTGKSFDITINGEEIEIDKTVVDQLADPLIHLVRNAADHGIESAAERQAAGKPAQGRIILSAAQQGQEIHITVSDDGKGLDRQAILNRARAAGIVGANEEPVDATVWNLIFESGFSTAAQVSNLSGRGVGMDVVQSVIRNLRGRIEVNTTPGQGTHIKLIIPVSLAFLSSMIVRSINRLYAIPINSVSQVFKPGADQVVRVSASGDVMVRRQDALVPVHWIHNVAERALNDQVIVVLQTARGALGLPVDEIIGEEQVMMKPLPEHLQDIRGGAGCAILGSGAIAIALDAERVSHDLSGAAGALR